MVDVYFLDPQVQGPNETVDEFASRVKAMIADAAGLKNVEWNGYLKYFKPNVSYLRERQCRFAEDLRTKLEFRAKNPGVSVSGPPSPGSLRKRLPPPNPSPVSVSPSEDKSEQSSLP